MATRTKVVFHFTLVFVLVFLAYVNSAPVESTTANVRSENHAYIMDTDCNNHGHCRVNGTGCDCDRGWITHGNNGDTNKYCTYRQRSKQTAFFLSLFAGTFGADWFYLSRSNIGYIVAGIFKLLLACGCCGAWPLSYFGPEIQNSESVQIKIRGVNTCFSLLAFGWWIFDWARILNNRFADGNGATLMPW